MLSNPYEALEFGEVAALLRRYTFSPLGFARIDDLIANPRLESADVASDELSTVAECAGWLRAAERADELETPPVPRFEGIADVREAVRRLSTEGIVLDAREIREILDLLAAAEVHRAALLKDPAARPGLHSRGSAVPDLRILVSELAGKILPNDEISSLASTALSRTRRFIEKQRQVVETSLERFVRKYADSGALQDRYVTMRNGRTVVPIKAQWKSRIDGIVHGASSTGQTVFVEPLDTIVQNNRLVRLREDEQAEILRILRRMSARLRSERSAIAATVTAVGDLEYLFARARFCVAFDCCLPRFRSPAEGRVSIREGRHPVLQSLLSKVSRRPVPMTVHLDGGLRTMIVSGPNAGGKTVVLKTIGVLAAMAQAGIPVPAESAEFPWFDRILADIGDAQSISESLSTFSAHVSRLTAILQSATRGSLVVLDELGTATDPEDGGALAIAVVERLQATGGFAIISTHLPELKMYGSGAGGILTASMGFDEARLSVTYRLQTGVPGQSAGLDMAERFGMPSEVVRRARSLKGRAGEQVEQFLSELRRQAGRYETLASEARAQAREFEARKREIEDQNARRSRELRRETEARIEELARKLEKRFQSALDAAVRRVQSASGKARRSVRRRAAQSLGGFRRAVRGDVASALGGRAAERLGDPGDEYAAGDRVRLNSMGATGEIVRKVGAGRWEVLAGRMRLKVATSEISKAESRDEGPVALPAGIRLETASEPGDVPSEINVIGKTAEEALSDVDKFLDRAVVANRSRLRVIHGFGKDVLRSRLWQMFATHVHVAKYYQAEQQDGGAGVTVVEVGDR
ncbi:MAG: Smr/MutS family protein [Bryobacterales bacterium]|nr:Smr/MutS family protein [Bryobacterales bacterium]